MGPCRRSVLLAAQPLPDHYRVDGCHPIPSAEQLFSGGYLVQLLPGASPETVDMVELNIATMLTKYDADGAAQLLKNGVSAAKMVEELLLDLGPG